LNIKDYSETLRGRAYCQRRRHGPGEVQSQSLKDGVLLGIEARQTGRQLPVDLIVQVRETGQGEQRFVEYGSSFQATLVEGAKQSVDDAETIVGDRRRATERELLRIAFARELPVLGVCRGMQVMNVAAGGTLGGSGAIGGTVTVDAGGTLAGIQGQILTMGALTLNAGSNTNASLGVPGATPLFNVTGNLTLGGTLNVSDLGGFGAGIYRLMDYGGVLTNNGLTIGAIPSGTTAANLSVQTGVVNQVNLVNTSGQILNFWDGGNAANQNNGVVNGGNGIWNAASGNWTNQNGTLNAPLSPTPGFAIFEAAPGVVTVDMAKEGDAASKKAARAEHARIRPDSNRPNFKWQTISTHS